MSTAPLTPALALIFPGQGSQKAGMGADIAAASPEARAIFQQADDLLGFRLSELCFNGDDALNQTINTQPALYVCSIATLRALSTPPISVCVAGHSLGEFTALTAAGALTFEDGLRLVYARARLMQAAGEATPGGMAAVLGLDAETVQTLCTQAANETSGVLVLANDNCPGQSVISGDQRTLEAGMRLMKDAGAKRVVPLAVSIAAHSPLMQQASDALKAEIDRTPFNPPQVPVYANVTAQPLHTVDEIRAELHQQLTQNVRWTATIQAMIAAGVTQFLEIGSGDVLTGLLKRIDRSVSGTALNSHAALEAWQAPR